MTRVMITAILLLAHPPAWSQSWGWDDGTVPYVQTPIEIVERTPEKPVGIGGNSKVELWIVPADVRGTWTSQIPQHGGQWRFQIGQRYQMLELEVRAEGRDLLARNTRLRGEEVKLVVTGVVKN